MESSSRVFLLCVREAETEGVPETNTVLSLLLRSELLIAVLRNDYDSMVHTPILVLACCSKRIVLLS